MITIIFGAGASHGSGDCSPTNPPLGESLFKLLVERQGAFSQLDEKQKTIFEQDGFEVGMGAIPFMNQKMLPLQRELACYFSEFEPNKNNAYVSFFNGLNDIIDNLCIVTTNYDLLIEKSLQLNNCIFDYNGNGPGVTLLKIHGSSNFLPVIPPDHNISGNKITINAPNASSISFVEGLKTKAVFTHKEVIDWCNDPRNNDICPVISIYAKNKNVVVNTGLINTIQTIFIDRLEKSFATILIGIKYIEHDRHIWDHINKNSKRILIVNPDPQNNLCGLDKNIIEKIDVIPKYFGESLAEIIEFVKSTTRHLNKSHI